MRHPADKRHQERPLWAEPLGDALRANVPLAPLTTFRIGGPAEWFYTAHTARELAEACVVARKARVPTTILGDGSNILISDRGIKGLVIHNRASRIARQGGNLFAESGALLADLVDCSRREALAGLEFASGIHGSVGGAIYGNAGAYGKSMADVLAWVEILTPEGRAVRVGAERMGFAYRRSGCATKKWLVLACEVGLQPGDARAISAEIERILAIRATKLPAGMPSAGSYFKNIEDPRAAYGKIPAGKLLEDVGAKELAVGGAAVYERHANVIVNRGDATAADVLRLAEKMKERVLKQFGIVLQPEVRFLGEPPE